MKIPFISRLIILLIIILGGYYQFNAKDYVPSEITKIIFLGTGTPNPDPEHSGISVLLLINNTPYIFDCGPGLVRNASKLNPKSFTL